MKRLLASILTLCLVTLNIMPALAATNVSLKDVSDRYWAYKEIQSVVNDGIMSTDKNKNFNPESSMTRVAFVESLLKILSNDKLNINIKNSFKDIASNSPYYGTVLRSEQLGLVYGYPDKTFRPTKSLLRSETTSILSHITNEKYTDMAILNQFTDKNSIPKWAKYAYAKTTHYGLYVNYPDAKVLNPNKELTRAEAAVLLYNLKLKLNLVKDKYKNEHVLRTEHLNVSRKADVDTVTITNLRKIIEENNLLQVQFDEKYLSKLSKAGDVINFVFEEDVYTKEGTLVIPANTKAIAQVLKVQAPQWFNKNARVTVKFNQLILPSGKTLAFSAIPYTKHNVLMEGPWMTAGKIALYTVGLGGVGAGAGIGFGFIPNPAKLGTGLAVGIPVGCTVGLATGLITKGLNYKARKGENLMLILDKDASIWNK